MMGHDCMVSPNWHTERENGFIRSWCAWCGMMTMEVPTWTPSPELRKMATTGVPGLSCDVCLGYAEVVSGEVTFVHQHDCPININQPQTKT